MFGWGRRVCVGMEYAATQMLVVCAAVSFAFNMDIAIDPATGEKAKISIENATPNVIPILTEGVPLIFNPRSAAQEQRLRDIYRLQKEQDAEPEEEECY